MVPRRLAAFEAAITAIDPDAQTICYEADAWARFFLRDRDLSDLLTRFPGTLSRGDLRILSTEAAADDGQIRRLFLAAMIWGFGSVGYGPYRTSQMLAIPAARQLLKTTAEHLAGGRLLEAYTTLRLPCCGPAFITKFFYAVGLGRTITPQPLILDSRVAASLQRIIDDEELPLSYYTKGAGTVVWYAQGYLRYVEALHAWSMELSCRADAIELFLFNPPPAFHTWRPAEASPPHTVKVL